MRHGSHTPRHRAETPSRRPGPGRIAVTWSLLAASALLALGGSVLQPAGATAPAAVRGAETTSAAGPALRTGTLPSLRTGEGTTVPAPGAGEGASVTVSKTQDLVNESVLVSWRGFRPSSSTRLENSGDSLDINTENPVRVYQCRGTDPASSSDCYGSPGFRGIEETPGNPAVPPVPAFTYPGQQNPFDATPDGPANWQDNVTRADGTGEVTIQLFTKRESSSLGCDATRPCSIVVVPNYGRPQGATEDQLDAPWAWERRTVVPLDFLPVDDACPLTGVGLRVEGSPFAGHVLASWRARTCNLAEDAVRIDYTQIGEPQVRSDLVAGTTDAGILIDPAEGEAAEARDLVYAPLAVTGLVVAFQIDDAQGRPIERLNLSPRLVAKLVTASYRSGGNPAVIDNPVNIFRDPELKELNPGVQFPGGAPGNHPLLLGDLSDSTLALTRWLAADQDARDFLAGKPDPWGMTVNSNYEGLDLPFAGFPLLDPLMSETFEPIQELDILARQLSLARFPGATVSQEGGVNVVTKPPRQNPGRREVIGIIDAASAARFRLPTASLRNASGAFVQPDTAGLLAGVEHSTVGEDGATRTVDQTSKDPAVYPLTLVLAGGFSAAAEEDERQEIADLLQYAAGPGQVPGEQVGQLPSGYAPLPAALRKQVTTARTAILAGSTPDEEPTEEPGGEDPTGGGSGGGLPGVDLGGGSGGIGGVPDATDPATGAPERAPGVSTEDLEPTMLAVSPTPVEGRLTLLPVLALLALVLLLSGPAVWWFGRPDRRLPWRRA